MHYCGLTHSHEPKTGFQVKAKVAAQGRGQSNVNVCIIKNTIELCKNGLARGGSSTPAAAGQQQKFAAARQQQHCVNASPQPQSTLPPNQQLPGSARTAAVPHPGATITAGQ